MIDRPARPRAEHEPDAPAAAFRQFEDAGIVEVGYVDRGRCRVQVLDPDGYRGETYAF